MTARTEDMVSIRERSWTRSGPRTGACGVKPGMPRH